MSPKLRLIAVLAIATALTGCGQAAAPSSSPTASSSPTTPPTPTLAPTMAPTPVPTAVPTASPTPVPTATPTAGPTTYATWHQVTGDPIDRIHQAYAVAWNGSVFVLAVTLENPATGRADGVAFLTAPADASAWTLVDERTAGWVNDFAFAPDRAGVAVGYLATTGAGWVSPDGRTWTRVPDQAALRPRTGEQSIVLGQVARGPVGYVAMGYTMPLAEKALLFTSPDGLTWTRQAANAMFSGVRFDGIAADGVRYVLTGHVKSPFRAAFWTSADGRTWTEMAPPPDVDPLVAATYDVDAGPAGWLLARRGPSAATEIWWSADGLAWTPRAQPDGDLVSYEKVVVATPTGFLADAWSEACTSDLWMSGDATAWTCVPGAPTKPHPNRTFAASGDAIVSVDPDGTTWVAILGD